MKALQSKRDLFSITATFICCLILHFSQSLAPAAEKTPVDETKTPWPQIVKTVPEMGATDVDPSLDQIEITFDRDMGKGMSWTGGPPHFPKSDKTRKANWTDNRTCILPVQLSDGKYYRVGINTGSYRNFKAANGVPAPSAVICFVTKGAKESVKKRVAVPQIVSLEPENDSEGIDPSVKFLKVTFDQPMGKGMSWTGGGPAFPEIPKGKRPRWSKDGKTCELPVNLKPGSEYQLGLNSLSHINFQSRWGVPIKPVKYQFSTK